MSRDDVKDCPDCKGKQCVSIYNTMDYKICDNGNILHDISGRCNLCDSVFYCFKAKELQNELDIAYMQLDKLRGKKK